MRIGAVSSRYAPTRPPFQLGEALEAIVRRSFVMRRSHTLGLSFFGALVAVACGGTSTSNNPPGADAGGDSSSSQNVGDASTVSNDGGGGDAEAIEDAACAVDADLLTLAPADAAINDAGASVGACLACAQTTCGTDLKTCNADCSCTTGFDCFAGCIGGVGNTLIDCADQCFPGGITGIESNSAEKGVVLCAAQQCDNQCGAAGLLGGGGTKDAGAPVADGGGSDGATDSSTDSAADSN
jgi:hypothetical protein